MLWIEAKITFSSSNDALAVELIADAFYALNAKGVVVDDPLLEPVEDWAPDAVARPTQPAVTGYLPADNHWERNRSDLEQAIDLLARDQGIDYSIAYLPIDEEDWAESWKAFFWPQKITPRIVVKPTWREYVTETDQLIIEIDPGMAFGTGTHPTTALCIQLMEKHLNAGDTVLDVGTGSGILLIAADKLGASRLTGIDLDPNAVEVARQNLNHNAIDPAMADLKTGDLVQAVTGHYDVVVSNILAEVILELLDDAASVVRSGGLFICSGIIEAYASGVAEKMAACGFDIVDIEKEGDWVALVGKMA